MIIKALMLVLSECHSPAFKCIVVELIIMLGTLCACGHIIKEMHRSAFIQLAYNPKIQLARIIHNPLLFIQLGYCNYVQLLPFNVFREDIKV